MGPGSPRPKRKKGRFQTAANTAAPPAAEPAAAGELHTAGSADRAGEATLQELNELLQHCTSTLPKSDPAVLLVQQRLADARAQKQALQSPGLRLKNSEGKLVSKQRQHAALGIRLAEQRENIAKTEAELAKTAAEVESIQKDVDNIKAELAAEAPPLGSGSAKEISQLSDLKSQLPPELHDQLAAPIDAILKAVSDFRTKQAADAAKAVVAQQQPVPTDEDDDMDFIFDSGPQADPEACKQLGELLATGNSQAFKKLRLELRQKRRANPYQPAGPAAPPDHL